ncbi:MAG: hypothetical protein L6R40_005964 [Gallowayella cf. fulva]|nr:MAG: hypothetical protein L6R40_005964 [Xanthomendoza cf. fulva]
MSFLNSVLSTIGGDGKQEHLPQTDVHPTPQPQKDWKNTDSKQKSVVSQPMISSAGQKRKAEDSLPSPKAKALKDGNGQKQASGITVPAVAPSAKQVERPSISTSKSALAVPYRGISRPSPTSASPGTPTTGAAKAAPPKKGSYAEIMARAAANNKPQLGVIKHKPKDTISAKKEIMMRKKGILSNGKAGINGAQNGKPDRNSNSPIRSTRNPKSPGLPDKKPIPQPSYKGTAAPKPQPTYKGTMKPGSSIANTARRKESKSDRSRSNSVNPSRRSREYECEEEEDEVDEEENGYSDESDDMEAGFSDVEEEETAAMKVARKEDEEQMRIENQLKKEKEERRKKLAAMAAKAPKPRY